MIKTGFVRQVRIAANPDEGTFGTVTLNGQPIAVYLEPYHRNNLEGVSSIPAGQYLAVMYNSPKYGWVWCIRDIQGREFIEYHWGNWDYNTKGCFVLGEMFCVLGGKWAVSHSKKAFNEFMSLTKDFEQLHITITESY